LGVSWMHLCSAVGSCFFWRSIFLAHLSVVGF
jgi:hypothetical protein